jgi:hypothetical protein
MATQNLITINNGHKKGPARTKKIKCRQTWRDLAQRVQKIFLNTTSMVSGRSETKNFFRLDAILDWTQQKGYKTERTLIDGSQVVQDLNELLSTGHKKLETRTNS